MPLQGFFSAQLPFIGLKTHRNKCSKSSLAHGHDCSSTIHRIERGNFFHHWSVQIERVHQGHIARSRTSPDNGPSTIFCFSQSMFGTTKSQQRTRRRQRRPGQGCWTARKKNFLPCLALQYHQRQISIIEPTENQSETTTHQNMSKKRT